MAVIYRNSNTMKKAIFIIIVSLVLTSCQSAKDAFTLKKRNSTDEFLVEKKRFSNEYFVK